MQPSSPRVSVLPSDWTQVLENIQSALDQALTATAERERMLTEQGSAEEAPAEPEASGQGRLERLDAGLRRFQSCFQEVERRAAEVDVQLQATQKTIQQWQAAASALRQRLVSGAAGSIK